MVCKVTEKWTNEGLYTRRTVGFITRDSSITTGLVALTLLKFMQGKNDAMTTHSKFVWRFDLFHVI
jgi:hypothetical protein